MTSDGAVGTPSSREADRDGTSFAPALVSLSGMGAELRRRWALITATTVLGGVLAMLLLMVTGGGATASTTLIVGHDPSTDPSRAIQTDLRLLKTRLVADEVISAQGLAMTADDFLGTVVASAPSSQLITVSVSAADAGQAVELVAELAEAFLRFRADVLTQQAEAAAQGNEELASSLVEQVAQITQQFEGLTGSSTEADNTRLNELVALRADLNAQVDRLWQGIRADQITLATVIGSSRVVDPATADPAPGRLTGARILVTGLVGGFASGVAVVVGYAILVDRPRRRSVISDAISAPVLLSVGKVLGRRRSARQARAVVSDRTTRWLADHRWGSSRLAVLGVSSEKETIAVAAALIRGIEGSGQVTAVDLTVSGRLAGEVGVAAISLEDWSRAALASQTDGPCVVRPGDVPTIHRPPGSLSAPPGAGGMKPSGDGFVVMVGQVSAALGAEHLAEWADTALFALKAGAATSEQLDSAATVVRSAGMVLVGAVLTDSDSRDGSVGEQPLHIPDHLERASVVPR